MIALPGNETNKPAAIAGFLMCWLMSEFVFTNLPTINPPSVAARGVYE